ncbi:MAG: protein serine/threonine phosphatase [Bacteroidetes bacterium]|jgi:serine phosphatase RsbU (regulator of sigma subunit)|nr:protein serine/threonine phosphatase [Bacteroidota bacterium]
MRRVKQIVFLFFIFFAPVLLSQESETIKQLKKKLSKQTKEDTARVNTLNNLGWEYSFQDIGISQDYCNQALALSLKIGFKDGEAEAYGQTGNNHRSLSNFDSALFYHNKSLAIRKNQNNALKIISSLINMANVYNQKKELSLAILKYNEAITMAEKEKYTKGALVGYTNISDAYRQAGLQQKALIAINKAININKQLKDSLQDSYLYATMATLQHEMNDLGAAKSNAEKALALLENNPNIFLKASVLHNLGTYYNDLRKYDSAMICLNKALEIETQTGDSAGMGISYNSIALLYQRLNQLDFCLAFAEKARVVSRNIYDTTTYFNSSLVIADVYAQRKDFKRALAYALEAQNMVRSIQNLTNIYEMYASLSNIYNGLGLHEKRAESLEKVIIYRDSILSNENKKVTARLSIEMDVYGKEKEIELLNKTTELKQVEIDRQKTAKTLITGIAALFGIIIIITIFFYIKIRKSNIVINKQKERVEQQNEIILSQKELVEEKQKEIIDSINYAKRIQSAVLTSEEVWKKISTEHFILFKPKDIVSGDFYWAYNTPTSRCVFALADCTGHGVPGGFMSMLGNSFLNEIVVENKIFSAATILSKLREKVIGSLEQKGDEQRKDGMDMALCVLNRINNTLEFAGANNGLILIRKGQLAELKPDKMPIGSYITDSKPFTSQTIQLEPGDCLYMTTDGFPDQFGGPKGKKFKYKQTEELLTQIYHLPMKEQGEIMEKKFMDWKGELEQIDDVCVIGVRI